MISRALCLLAGIYSVSMANAMHLRLRRTNDEKRSGGKSAGEAFDNAETD